MKINLRSRIMRKIKAAFVGFGEVNTPTEIITKKCLEAKKLVED